MHYLLGLQGDNHPHVPQVKKGGIFRNFPTTILETVLLANETNLGNTLVFTNNWLTGTYWADFILIMHN